MSAQTRTPHAISLWLAVTLLVGAAAAASAQTSAVDPCRAIFAGDPDAGGTDPQPTEAEIRQRLAEAGCPTDDVETSPGVAREEEKLQQELMEQSAGDGQAEPGK